MTKSYSAALRLVVTDKVPRNDDQPRAKQPAERTVGSGPETEHAQRSGSRRAAPLEPTLKSGAETAGEAWRPSLFAIGLALALAGTVTLGWNVRNHEWYTPAKGLGYALGLVGGSLMLLLMLYPVRKHFQFLHVLGPLKHWFRLHMVGGIVGPLLVLFHSRFQIGSLNAAVALSCMLLVVTSGLVGRFFYRRIHSGLYGSHTTLADLQQSLHQQLETLTPLMRLMPLVSDELARFNALVNIKPEGLCERSAHFLMLGWKRLQTRARVGRAIAVYVHPGRGDSVLPHADLHELMTTIDAALSAAQKAAQFSTYERLFSLWHVVHIPFLCLLVITAVVHVVAVHIY